MHFASRIKAATIASLFILAFAALVVVVFPGTGENVFDKARYYPITDPALLRNLNGHIWFKRDGVFIYGRQRTRFIVEQLNVNSGERQRNHSLEQILIDAGDPSEPKGIDWDVSSNGNRIAILTPRDAEGDSVRTINADGSHSSGPYRPGPGFMVTAFFWIPGSERWLVVGRSNATVMAVWEMEDKSVRKSILPITRADAAGMMSDNCLLFLSSTNAGFVQGTEVQLIPTPSIRNTWAHTFSRRQDIAAAHVSPDGSCILWLLIERPLIPQLARKIGLQGAFGLEDGLRGTLWKSRVNGNSWVCLGRVPEQFPLGDSVKWLPDGLRASALVGGKLCVISVREGVAP